MSVTRYVLERVGREDPQVQGEGGPTGAGCQ